MRDPRAVVRIAAFGVLSAAWVGATQASAAGPRDATQAEYERRVAALDADDLEGHFELALWCKERKAYELVRKQCTLILAQNGNHAQAKLLLKLAMRHLGEPAADPQGPGASSGPSGATGTGALPRVVTDDEIQRVRWAEMMDAEPRPLAVRFKNRVVRRFLETMEGTAGFTTREDRRGFMRLQPTEKVRLIRRHTGDRFAGDIVIKTDPKRMADFDRRVLPVVLSGCGTSACHGNPSASRFALYHDRLLSENKVYANYLIMHDYRVGSKRLINRDSPGKSLLLTYGFHELPAALGDDLDRSFKHPLVGEPRQTEIRAIFRGTGDPKYQAIRDWLESLSALEPDYGISLNPGAPRP